MTPAVMTGTLRSAARKLGIHEGALRSDLPETLGIPSFIPPNPVRHWERVLARSRKLLAALPPPTGPRVVFITTVARGINNPGYVAVMAYALRLRGAQPFVVYCDGALPACEHATVFYMTPEEFIEEGSRRLCARCYKPGEALYQQLGLPTYRLSEFLDADAARAADTFVRQLPREEYYTFRYKGALVGPDVEASMTRFFYSHTPDQREVTWRVAERMIRGAVLMVEAVRRMHERLQPEIFVPHYGTYLSRGAALATARSLGKRAVTWGRGYVEEAIVVGNDAHAFTEIAERTEGPWNTLSLTRTQEEQLDRFLQSRVQGLAFKIFNRNPLNDKPRLLAELDLDPTRPIISLFTNVGFDSKCFYNTALYPDVLLWIYDSIEVFRNRREQLVIRIHPGELWRAQAERTSDRLRERFPVLPSNIRVIAPESRLSSYTLSELSQAVIVYGSLIGLEVTMMDKPVIVAGRGSYWQKGFTYDVHTRADYLAYLDRLEELARPDPARVEAARRFAYYFFFMRQVPFLHWNHDVHPGLRLKPWWKVFRSLDDLRPGREPNLDAICEQILSGQEALGVWPGGDGAGGGDGMPGAQDAGDGEA